MHERSVECITVMHDIAADEVIARRVAGVTLADLRTVRREMREPGSVRGLIGQRIRESLRVTTDNQPAPIGSAGPCTTCTANPAQSRGR